MTSAVESDHATAALPIRQLLDPAAYGHPTGQPRLMETHISWVVLTGTFAYKIKKPVRYEFLDASTLELRKHYCEEELRLNRRLAPDLYLDVVPIALVALPPNATNPPPSPAPPENPPMLWAKTACEPSPWVMIVPLLLMTTVPPGPALAPSEPNPTTPPPSPPLPPKPPTLCAKRPEENPPLVVIFPVLSI